MRAVLWFQTMSCYDATLGKPEGDYDAQQEQAFQKMDTLFKAALLSVLVENIVDAYASIDNGKDMWDALEAKFGVSDAGTELYIMEQFYDYRMTEERSVVEQAHEIQCLLENLSTSIVCYRTSLLPEVSSPSFLLHGGTLLPY